MLKFIKEIFVSTIILFGSLSSVNPLKCVSMNNQKCKVRPEIVNANSKEPVYFLLVLTQVNAVVVVTTSMIHMQNYVLQILLKI